MKFLSGRTICVFAILLHICSFPVAQVLPEPGATLNFTQVMFEHGKVAGAEKYIIQIAYDRPGAGFQNPVIERADSSTAALVSDLKFGQKYVWRYCGVTGGVMTGWHGPFEFTIAGDDFLNRKLGNVGILVDEQDKNAGGLIVADLGVIIGRDGKPVWYMPELKTKITTTRNLEITPFGTLTCLNVERAFELDLRGNVLWRAPNDGQVSGDTSEFYHHDFQRLKNGNFMILGNKYVWRKVPPEYVQYFPKTDSTRFDVNNKLIGGKQCARITMGTIIEYNKEGRVVWVWDSDKYFKDDEVFSLLSQAALRAKARDMTGASALNDRDTHLNAFAVDNKNEFVYAGFRQISRLVKIEKSTGKVVCSWGQSILPGDSREGNNFFYHQHGANLFSDGSISVFNNSDGPEWDAPARAVIFSQPSDSGHSKILWQFNCVFDSVITKSDRGGNVDELPNGNILISMGMGPLKMVSPAGIRKARLLSPGIPDSCFSESEVEEKMEGTRIFELTRDKKIVWSALVKISPKKGPYRAHYTSSLYPCYFTVQPDFDTLTGTSVSFNLKIFNVGTERDTYHINISSALGYYQNQFLTSEVAGGKSTGFEISPAGKPVTDDVIKIAVQSETNPGFIRTLNVIYNK